VLVLGDMLELGDCSHAEHRILASLIDTVGADLVILVGSEMKAAVGSLGAIYVQVSDAVDSIVPLLKTDDLVLLKGSRSLQLERIIESVRQIKVLEH
jgi:UDP-N-acetylmuramoyl-tripeptide--D-alanyl-D-alanine ligase